MQLPERALSQIRRTATLSRRNVLHRVGGGFLGVALGGLLTEAGEITASSPSSGRPAQARSVIFLFMCGGVSHIDTFDPKDNKWAGTLIDAVGFGDNLAAMRRPVIPCRRKFTRYGESGIAVSDWFPEIGGVIDDVAVVRSMWGHESNHFPAVIETCTGHRRREFDHPSFGSWIVHALGSANQNLPTFVNMGRPTSPVQLTGGYLGSSVAATPFQLGESPIPNLQLPKASSTAERDAQMRVLEELNREFRNRYAAQSEIAGRMQAYELAARMQLAAPDVVDLTGESPHTLALYGVDQKETEAFGRQLLLARRLSERGVRFIQICHAGGGNGSWDAHDDIKNQGPLCRATDKPIAGLIRDLKQRGLLESTLVVWTSEFGRSPWSQNTTGRDHNPRGYTTWLAGGGVQGGRVHGATDDVGYRAVENRHYCSDLHATILHQLGLDHTQMEIEILGRPLRLIDDETESVAPILEILS